MFPAGAAVRVKNDWPEARGPVHIRTPHYVRGQKGTIVRHLGDFPNPEDLAFARPAADCRLYHVAFPMEAVWDGNGAPDELLIELYGHWLEPA
ncbi:MAG: SH3-like domain-containing protein [Rhodospirillales bacterium]